MYKIVSGSFLADVLRLFGEEEKDFFNTPPNSFLTVFDLVELSAYGVTAKQKNPFKRIRESTTKFLRNELQRKAKT